MTSSESKHEGAVRIANILSKELASLLSTVNIPFIRSRFPTDAIAALHVVKTTFDVAIESSPVEAITAEEKEAETLSLIANLLAMAYIAKYATAGMAELFPPIDEGHEILSVSSQRIGALADELALLLTRASLIAVLYGITPEEM